MGMDTVTVILVIVLAGVLMFIFPLMTMADRTDDVAQSTVETLTSEYADTIGKTGKITLSDYDKFIQNLSSTGNAYDVEIEVKVLDENPGKKTTQANSTKIGENVYYSMYTSQILDYLEPDSTNPNQTKVLKLKEGDMVVVSVKNTNTTLSQQLSGLFYSASGNDIYTNAAEKSVMVTANGTGE